MIPSLGKLMDDRWNGMEPIGRENERGWPNNRGRSECYINSTDSTTSPCPSQLCCNALQQADYICLCDVKNSLHGSVLSVLKPTRCWTPQQM